MRRTLSTVLLLGLLLPILAGCNSRPAEQAPQVIAANEMAAISRLRSIATAESQYSINSGGTYATLDQLINDRLISDPSEGKLTGYRYAVKVRQGGFEATAVPIQTGISGRRSFYIDETRVIRGADKRGEQAGPSDPEV
jgi:hypothetical protein